ncbi:hypothetical protein ES708_19218 [subsurface metagenome]
MSTSLSQLNGSTLLILQVPRNEYVMAARLAPSCEPARLPSGAVLFFDHKKALTHVPSFRFDTKPFLAKPAFLPVLDKGKHFSLLFLI